MNEPIQTPSNWSEVLMGLLILILSVNYLIIPLFNLFKPVSMFQIPTQLWDLAKLILPMHLVHLHLPKFLDTLTPKDGK